MFENIYFKSLFWKRLEFLETISAVYSHQKEVGL